MMEAGAITDYFNVAQVAIWAFWIFFAVLIWYLLREGRREGFPLVADMGRGASEVGADAMPRPKTFNFRDGTSVSVPRDADPQYELKAEKTLLPNGFPLAPTGNPMLDGVGPAAYALRQDKPDMTWHGEPVLKPMRNLPDFSIAPGDPDPRGWDVIGGDNKVAGTVKDLWIDHAEQLIRYVEINAAGKSVLAPMTLCKVNAPHRRVRIRSILSTQFADVPTTRNPDQVTLLEEDKISAYYGGGTFYATPDRSEPFL